MPNWCYTRIQILSDDESSLHTLFDNIIEWIKNEVIENGFGEGYLGNIVAQSGIAEYDKKSKHFVPEIKCRGSITDISIVENFIEICTETAWEPMIDMWYKIAEKYLKENTYQILWSSEETGLCIFLTNDSNIADTYLIGFNLIDDESIRNEFEDIFEQSAKGEIPFVWSEDLIQYLQDLLHSDSEDIEYLLKSLKESKYSKYLNIWNYKLV